MSIVAMDSAGERADVTALFRAALALAALLAAAAILAGRDLVYDGSYYLLGIAARGGFQLLEPARVVPQLLQQCFAVAGARAGIHDLWTLGVLFSLGCSGWRVLLTGLCWFVLPRGQKDWIAGPLLNLVFAIPATSFIGIGEGIVGSCLLWLAFLLIEFRSASFAGAVAALVATAACCFSHEAAALCLLLLALAALLRAPAVKGFPRVALWAAAALALAGAGNMARWTLFPRSAIERGDFLASMLGGFLGTPAAPNIPALMSLAAAGCCVVALALGGRQARVAAAVAMIIAVIFPVLLVAFPGALIVPSRFFAARGLPIAVTTLLIGLFLVLRWRGVTPARFATRPVIVIVASLVIAQGAAQAVITAEWVSYVRGLGALVAGGAGVVSHEAARQRLDPDGARFRRELLESWSVEPLALLLAPQGKVRAFVAASPQARWVPYDPKKPATLPHPPELDYSGFAP